MRRRDIMVSLTGAAAWPKRLSAQQPERMRRIGILMTLAADDSESRSRLAAFFDGVRQSGWIDGRNLRIDLRWGGGGADTSRRAAAELTAFAPDVILANGSAAVAALLKLTPTLPVVFTSVIDPVGSGFVESLARPGGNATGFTLSDSGTSAKWLELLKEIAPGVTRAAVLRDATIASGNAQLAAIQAAAASFGVALQPVDLRDGGEIERSIEAFARVPHGGLIVTASALANAQRERIVAAAARNRLPAVYFQRFFVTAGGLVSYGVDVVEQYRQAAGYVDRILKGERPANLPVQAPTKYELAINLKTAKALDLDPPSTLLARADDVIE